MKLSHEIKLTGQIFLDITGHIVISIPVNLKVVNAEFGTILARLNEHVIILKRLHQINF